MESQKTEAVAGTTKRKLPEGMVSIEAWIQSEMEKESDESSKNLPNAPGSRKAARAANAAKAEQLLLDRQAERDRKIRERENQQVEDEEETLLIPSDYISHLNGYRQTHPSFSGPTYVVEEELTDFGTRFSCVITIGESEGEFGARLFERTFKTKQRARQYAAKCALEYLTDPQRSKEAAEITKTELKKPAHDKSEELSASVDYVTKLNLHCQAHKRTFQPLYAATDKSSRGGTQRWACTVTIDDSGKVFGTDLLEPSFTTKQQAKNHAAKCALEMLETAKAGNQPLDLANSSKPTAPHPATPTRPPPPINPSPILSPKPILAETSQQDTAESSASRVTSLCHYLGLSLPEYKILAHKDFPSMYSGHALFPGQTRIPEKIAEFRNVYGKKNAREACAELVVEFLEGHEMQRGREDEERRRVAREKMRLKAVGGSEVIREDAGEVVK